MQKNTSKFNIALLMYANSLLYILVRENCDGSNLVWKGIVSYQPLFMVWMETLMMHDTAEKQTTLITEVSKAVNQTCDIGMDLQSA